MNKKSLLCLLAVCAMLFALCGGAMADTPWADAVTAAEADAQLEVLFKNLTALTPAQDVECFYTVTDLDRNGRLELIAALKRGTDGSTVAKIAEMGTALDGADVLELPAGADNSLPALLTTEAKVLADAKTGEVHYLLEDTEMNGAAVAAVSTGSLTLKDGKLSFVKVSAVEYTEQRGLTIMNFTDGKGNQLSPDEYENAAANLYKGAEEGKVNFQWFTAEECTSADVLKASYAVFTGEQAADENAAAMLNTKVNASANANIAEGEVTFASNELVTIRTAEGECSFVIDNNTYVNTYFFDAGDSAVITYFGDLQNNPVATAIEITEGKKELVQAPKAEQDDGQIIIVKPGTAGQTQQPQQAGNGQQIFSSVEEARQALGIKENKQQNNSSGIYIVETPQPEHKSDPIPAPTMAPQPIIDDPSQSGQGAGSGSFTSDTGTALNIYASYNAVTLGSNLVQVTVSANLSHSSLTARANTVSFNLGGDYGSATAPEINCSGGSSSTYLGSNTFTVPLAPGESKSLNCSVSWNFGGTYSGVSIAAVTANGTVYLSR